MNAVVNENITGVSISDIKARIEQDWTDETSLLFSQNGWDFHIPQWNKTDIWATKTGTKGKTRRTFCRLSTRGA